MRRRISACSVSSSGVVSDDENLMAAQRSNGWHFALQYNYRRPASNMALIKVMKL
jgi:hypothetical protein